VKSKGRLSPEERLGLAVTIADGQGDAWAEPTVDGRRAFDLPVIPGFVIDGLHAEGGFSWVYQARDAATGRQVAIKVMRRELVSWDEAQRRFQQEAELIQTLHHPNIVEVLGWGELPGPQPYMVMEWLEGRGLDEELRDRGPLSPSDALAVVEEIGGALSAAHGRGVIHRDLKAQNVVALPRGDWFTAKLVDFGIAKHLGREGGDLTGTGRVLGSPVAMAPEQILGARDVDARADVYSLGVLVYQLVTGRLPYPAVSILEIEEQHLHAPPPSASDVALVPLAFSDAIIRALQKDRAHRFASVEDMLAALRQAIAPAAPGRTLSLHIEVTALTDDDAAYDQAEEGLAAARRALGEAGVAITLETSSAVVGQATLGGDEPARRRELVGLALGIAAAAGDQVRLAVGLHIGGPGLGLGWTLDHPGQGVAATAAVLAGLEGELVLGGEGPLRTVTQKP
jgi:eukaryotic-like serine/threonine-protein kinase